jgi:predicted dehydrogenase
LRVGIVGAGRMGRIRCLSARAHPQSEVVGVFDTVAEHARALASEAGCSADTDWQKLVERKDIDAIVVATPHKYLAPITMAASRAGKYVFCEKPGARNATEAELVLRTVSGGSHPAESESLYQSNPLLTVGFTLRHYPAIRHARDLVAKGVIGRLLYIRACYGHGGRPDYNLEWRGDLELAGGGELLDQGVHLIDLSRWFLGEFEQVFGSTGTYFWGSGRDRPTDNLEDNAFLSLRTETGTIAWLHASWTQWKNLFSFEIYGSEGSLEVNGLAGHYGPQTLRIARRRAQGGAPELQELEFGPDKDGHIQDEVWAHEWAAFISNVVDYQEGRKGRYASYSACGIDAWESLRIVDAAYEASRSGKNVTLSKSAAGSKVCSARQ